MRRWWGRSNTRAPSTKDHIKLLDQLPLGIADANGDLTVALPAPGFQLRLVGQMQLFAFQTTGLDVATSDSAAFDI